MKVKALKRILYNDEIYDAGTIFEMDDCTAAISEKYGKIIVFGGGGAVEDSEEEFEPAEGLPDLIAEKAAKKKK